MNKRLSTPTDRDALDSCAVDEYRAQITACARSLSVAHVADVTGYLAAGNTSEMVKMFTDGNLDKRFLKLKDHLELLNGGFPEMEDLIAAYVKTIPLAAYDTGSSDAEHFLEWLQRSRSLTPEQIDLITCQRARRAVEELAAANRLQHLRFQDFAVLRERLLPEWGARPELRIELNPVRVWATFSTPVLLGEGDEPPATVIFFPVENDIHTAVLEPQAQSLIQDLEARGPSRLDDLASDCLPDVREEIIELCRDLVELGLAALM